MLVLGRRTNEKIVIRVGGEEIEVLVVRIKGDECRLGFSASKRVEINRYEIQRKIDSAEEPA